MEKNNKMRFGFTIVSGGMLGIDHSDLVYFYTMKFLFALAALAALWAAPPCPAADAPLIINHADRFEFLDRGGVKYQRLVGHVDIRYKDTRVFSDTTVHFHNHNRIEFNGRVTAKLKVQTLSADRVTYFKKDSSVSARGHVVLKDPEQYVRITGGAGEYQSRTEESRIWIDPVFLRTDSSGRDSLFIYASVMKHFGKEKKAVAKDSVRIVQGKTRGRCQTAEYFKDTESARLLDSPVVYYEKNLIKGDTIRLFFKDQALDRVYVTGSASGTVLEEDDKAPDSAKVSILTGDTLIAYIRENAINRMEILGHAVGVNYVRGDSLNVNRMTGKYMDFFFSDNRVDSTHVFGNATSVYHYRDQAPQGESGRNETSGDSLNIYFDSQRVSRIQARGGVKGTYYKE